MEPSSCSPAAHSTATPCNFKLLRPVPFCQSISTLQPCLMCYVCHAAEACRVHLSWSGRSQSSLPHPSNGVVYRTEQNARDISLSKAREDNLQIHVINHLVSGLQGGIYKPVAMPEWQHVQIDGNISPQSAFQHFQVFWPRL